MTNMEISWNRELYGMLMVTSIPETNVSMFQQGYVILFTMMIFLILNHILV
jgi:hypothetical protein